MLNLALLVMKCNTKPGLPVLSAWISSDGHYAFVEFRTIEECNNGFQLSSIAIFGHVSSSFSSIIALESWKDQTRECSPGQPPGPSAMQATELADRFKQLKLH
jgi:hypothetical protein